MQRMLQQLPAMPSVAATTCLTEQHKTLLQKQKALGILLHKPLGAQQRHSTPQTHWSVRTSAIMPAHTSTSCFLTLENTQTNRTS
jgi:hypothetical protein